MIINLPNYIYGWRKKNSKYDSWKKHWIEFTNDTIKFATLSLRKKKFKHIRRQNRKMCFIMACDVCSTRYTLHWQTELHFTFALPLWLGFFLGGASFASRALRSCRLLVRSNCSSGAQLWWGLFHLVVGRVRIRQ